MAEADASSNNLAETLKLLKCTICSHILSIPPILAISDDEYQCGRCKDIKYSKSAIRNVIFERVSKYLNFPCVHTHCEKLVPWKDIETHENNCDFKTITCPMFHEDCNEEINLNDLTQHMVQKHGNYMFFENIVVTVAMFKSYVCVASVDSMVFLIYICSDKVLVTSVKSSDKALTYTLKLSRNDKNTPSIFYENQTIEEFNERKHCFRCLDKRCGLKYHPFSTFNRPPTNDTVTTSSDDCTRSTDKVKKAGFARPPTYKNISLVLPATTKASSGSIFGGSIFDSPVTSLFAPVTVSSSSTFSLSLSSNATATQQPLGAPAPLSSNTVSSLNANAAAFYFQPPHLNSTSNVNGLVKNNKVKETIQNTDTDSNSGVESVDKSENESSQVKEIKSTTFNLIHIHNLIGVTSSVTFTITISTNDNIKNGWTTLDDSFIPRHLLSTIDNSDLLRKSLECPICTEDMVNSIYVCERGHHICERCKILNSCPTCQGVLADCRNFALENIAETVSLSCCFKENGCEFRGNLKTISEHEKNCAIHKDDC